MSISDTIRIGQDLLKILEMALVFEVSDDPNDPPEHRDLVRPIAVRVVFTDEDPPPDLPRAISAWHKGTNVYFVGNITKATDITARTLTTKGARESKTIWAYILAEPLPGWENHYKPRQFRVPVSSGRIHNITVSLEPK